MNITRNGDKYIIESDKYELNKFKYLLYAYRTIDDSIDSSSITDRIFNERWFDFSYMEVSFKDILDVLNIIDMIGDKWTFNVGQGQLIHFRDNLLNIVEVRRYINLLRLKNNIQKNGRDMETD